MVPDTPFGFGLPGGAAPDPNDPAQMQQFLGQLQQLFAGSGSGPVNWDLARQVATATLTGGAPAGAGMTFGPAIEGEPAEPPPGDPRVTEAECQAVTDAPRPADLWLEPASSLPSGIQTVQAWSRGEGI